MTVLFFRFRRVVSFFLLLFFEASHLSETGMSNLLSELLSEKSSARSQSVFESSRSEIRKQTRELRAFHKNIPPENRSQRSELRVIHNGSTEGAILLSKKVDLGGPAESLQSVRIFSPSGEDSRFGVIELAWRGGSAYWPRNTAFRQSFDERIDAGRHDYTPNYSASPSTPNGSMVFFRDPTQSRSRSDYFAYTISPSGKRFFITAEHHSIAARRGETSTSLMGVSMGNLPYVDNSQRDVRGEYICFDPTSGNLWLFTAPIDDNPLLFFRRLSSSPYSWDLRDRDQEFPGWHELFDPKDVRGIQYDQHGEAVWLLTQADGGGNSKATLHKVQWSDREGNDPAYVSEIKNELSIPVLPDEKLSFYVDDEGCAWVLSPGSGALYRYDRPEPDVWDLKQIFPAMKAHGRYPFSIDKGRLVIGGLIDPRTAQISIVDLAALKPTSVPFHSGIKPKRDFPLNGYVNYELAEDLNGEIRLVVYEDHNGQSYYVSQPIRPDRFVTKDGKPLAFTRSSLSLHFESAEELKQWLRNGGRAFRIFAEDKTIPGKVVRKTFIEISFEGEMIKIELPAGVDLTKDWDSWLTLTEDGKVVFLQSDITAAARLVKAKYISGTYDPISKQIRWLSDWQILTEAPEATVQEGGNDVRKIDQRVVGLASVGNKVFTLRLDREGNHRLLEFDLSKVKSSKNLLDGKLQGQELEIQDRELIIPEASTGSEEQMPVIRERREWIPEFEKGEEWKTFSKWIVSEEGKRVIAIVQQNQKTKQIRYCYLVIDEHGIIAWSPWHDFEKPKETFFNPNIQDVYFDPKAKRFVMLGKIPHQFPTLRTLDNEEDRAKKNNANFKSRILPPVEVSPRKEVGRIDFWDEREPNLDSKDENERAIAKAIELIKRKLGEGSSVFGMIDLSEQWGVEVIDLPSTVRKPRDLSPSEVFALRFKSNRFIVAKQFLNAIDPESVGDIKFLASYLLFALSVASSYRERIEVNERFRERDKEPYDLSRVIYQRLEESFNGVSFREGNDFLKLLDLSLPAFEKIRGRVLRELNRKADESELKIKQDEIPLERKIDALLEGVERMNAEDLKSQVKIEEELKKRIETVFENAKDEPRQILHNFIWKNVLPIAFHYQRKQEFEKANEWFDRAFALMDLLLKVDSVGLYPVHVIQKKIELLIRIGRVGEAYTLLRKLLTAEYAREDLREGQEAVQLWPVQKWMTVDVPQMMLRIVLFEAFETDVAKKEAYNQTRLLLWSWIVKIQDFMAGSSTFARNLIITKERGSLIPFEVRALNDPKETIGFAWQKKVDEGGGIHILISAHQLLATAKFDVNPSASLRFVLRKKGGEWVASPDPDPGYFEELPINPVTPDEKQKKLISILFYLYSSFLKKSKVDLFIPGVFAGLLVGEGGRALFDHPDEPVGIAHLESACVHFLSSILKNLASARDVASTVATSSPSEQRSELRVIGGFSAIPDAKTRYEITRMRILPPPKTAGRVTVWESKSFADKGKRPPLVWRGFKPEIANSDLVAAQEKVWNVMSFIDGKIQESGDGQSYEMKKIFESFKNPNRRIELVNVPNAFREDFSSGDSLSLTHIVDFRYKNRAILFPSNFLHYLQGSNNEDESDENRVGTRVLAAVILKAMQMIGGYEEAVTGLFNSPTEGEFPPALSAIYSQLGEQLNDFWFDDSDEILKWLDLSVSDFNRVLDRIKLSFLSKENSRTSETFKKVEALLNLASQTEVSDTDFDYPLERAHYRLPLTSVIPQDVLPNEDQNLIFHSESEREIARIGNILGLGSQPDFTETRSSLHDFIWRGVVPIAYDYQRKGELENADLWFDYALKLMDLLIVVDYKGAFPLLVMKDKVRFLAQIGRIEEAYVAFYQMLSAEYVPAPFQEAQKNVHYFFGDIYEWLKKEVPKLILKAIWFRSVETGRMRKARLLEIERRLNLWLEKVDDINKDFQGFFKDLISNRDSVCSKPVTVRALNENHHAVDFKWERINGSDGKIHISVEAGLSFSGGAVAEKIGHFKTVWAKENGVWVSNPETDPRFLENKEALWRTAEGGSVSIKYIKQMLIYLQFKLMQKSGVTKFRLGMLHRYFLGKKKGLSAETVFNLTPESEFFKLPVLIAENMKRVQDLAFPGQRSELRLANVSQSIFELNNATFVRIHGIGLNKKINQEILIWAAQNPENLKVIVYGIGELPQALKGFSNILLENNRQLNDDDGNAVTISYVDPDLSPANADRNFFSEDLKEGFLSAVLLRDQLSDQVFARRNSNDPYLVMAPRFKSSVSDWFKELWSGALVASSA